MIRDIIIPENIGSYYIFSKRIVGIEINKTEIHATTSLISGYNRTILNMIEEKIENNSSKSYEDRVIQALKKIKTKLGKFNEIYLSLSSSSVIFKELTIPFLGLKKIKMILPFEVESLLPFTLDSAVINCIVTKEDKIGKQTDIFVAAIKKDQIEQYLDLFEKAQLKIDKITVDIFELYSLYKSIPAYTQLNQNVVLIDIGLHVSRLAIIIKNQLKYIRVLPKGIITIAKKLAATLSIETNEALNQLFRIDTLQESGIQDNNYINAINDLIYEIQFTIASYIKKSGSQEEINQILLAGNIADITNISELFTNSLHIKTNIFETKNILKNTKIKSKIVNIPNSFLISIASSLALNTTNQFNLLTNQVSINEESIIKKQLIWLGIIISLILGSFSIYSFLKISNLKTKINSSEKEAIAELKKSFKLKDPRTLTEANKKARQELHQQENTWQQLSLENRYSFLQYLSELSKCINSKETQLDLTSLTIKENVIKLYGSVPGYPQLTKLQNQLTCPLIKNVPRLHEYNFKANPIVLILSKDQE